jgi:hypothetical protein
MPRIAALIPADASENKEMPQRAGIAVIAPFPLAFCAAPRFVPLKPAGARPASEGWLGWGNFVCAGYPDRSWSSASRRCAQSVGAEFFFGVEFTPRSWLVESVEAICACEEDLDTSRAPKN